MYFAITALGVSAIQIALGIAIGLALRKRRLAACDADSLSDTLPVDWPMAETAERPVAGSTSAPGSAADRVADRASRRKPATEDIPATAAARAAAMDQSEQADTGRAESATQQNRRQSPRRPFQYRQQVAPYHGGSPPGKASFREVECQDISSTGFSFLSSQLPDFDSIVVALGVAPGQVYLCAHIVSRLPLNESPAPVYRIGCRFTGPVSQ